jgi:hypothetical protein
VTKNLLSQAPTCFGRYVKPLVPAAFAVMHLLAVVHLFANYFYRRSVVKIIAESLSQHDEKHDVPTPLSGITVEKKEGADKKKYFMYSNRTSGKRKLSNSFKQFKIFYSYVQLSSWIA